MEAREATVAEPEEAQHVREARQRVLDAGHRFEAGLLQRIEHGDEIAERLGEAFRRTRLVSAVRQELLADRFDQNFFAFFTKTLRVGKVRAAGEEEGRARFQLRERPVIEIAVADE